MDWEFVDPDDPGKRRYLRLHIQAKRAKLSKAKNKSSRYWCYKELDHAAPKGAHKGTQHAMLLSQAYSTSGCVPLYAFYHPLKATLSGTPAAPAIKGVNLMFADRIPVQVTKAGWPVADKKPSKWQPHFMPLSTVLCLGAGPALIGRSSDPGAFFLLFLQPGGVPTPGAVADRLNELRGDQEEDRARVVEVASEIPQRILAAIEERRDREGDGIRKRLIEGLERPRLVFNARGIRASFFERD